MKQIKVYGLLSILFLSQLTFSQSIHSHMMNCNRYDKNANIAEIIETSCFFNLNSTTKEIEYKSFTPSMKIKSIKRFNEQNKLLWLSMNTYDSLQRIVRINNKKWINVIGYQTNYSIYKYDSLNNCIQIDYNSRDQIISIAKFYYDNNSMLTRLEIYDPKGNLIGYETASYDPHENKMRVYQYNNQNQLINDKESPLRYGGKYKQRPSNKYNEQGDLIYWEANWNENDHICYTTEYKYDEKGNWISKKRYQYIKTKKGKLKRKKLTMTKSRKITYNTGKSLN